MASVFKKNCHNNVTTHTLSCTFFHNRAHKTKHFSKKKKIKPKNYFLLPCSIIQSVESHSLTISMSQTLNENLIQFQLSSEILKILSTKIIFSCGQAKKKAYSKAGSRFTQEFDGDNKKKITPPRLLITYHIMHNSQPIYSPSPFNPQLRCRLRHQLNFWSCLVNRSCARNQHGNHDNNNMIKYAI